MAIITKNFQSYGSHRLTIPYVPVLRLPVCPGVPAGRAWYGMERNEISVWNMEDFKNGMEGNLPYIHTRIHALYLQKNTYQCRVVINNIVTEVFNFHI